MSRACYRTVVGISGAAPHLVAITNDTIRLATAERARMARRECPHGQSWLGHVATVQESYAVENTNEGCSHKPRSEKKRKGEVHKELPGRFSE